MREKCYNYKNIQLNDHQIEPILFLCTPRVHGVLVVHPTGAGKTFTSIASAKCLLEQRIVERAVAVVPKSIVRQYTAEVLRFGIDPKRFMVLTVHGLLKDPSISHGSFLILDEAHEYATPTKTTKLVYEASLRAARVLLMTATPFQNEISDITLLIGMVKGIDLKDLTGDMVDAIHQTEDQDGKKMKPEKNSKLIRSNTRCGDFGVIAERISKGGSFVLPGESIHGNSSNLLCSPSLPSEVCQMIKENKIPPGYPTVEVCGENDKLLYVAIDSKGRAKYKYTEDWDTEQEEHKLLKMRHLTDKFFQELDDHVFHDLKEKKWSVNKLAALATSIMRICPLRPGSESGINEGLTTISNHEIRFSTNVATLSFTGKSYQTNTCDIRDSFLISLLQELAHNKQKKLLAIGKFSLTAARLRAYLREFNLTPKNFRTYIGNSHMLQRLSESPVDLSPTARKRYVGKVTQEIADILQNTPAVAKKKYVFSGIIDLFVGLPDIFHSNFKPDTSDKLQIFIDLIDQNEINFTDLRIVINNDYIKMSRRLWNIPEAFKFWLENTTHFYKIKSNSKDFPSVKEHVIQLKMDDSTFLDYTKLIKNGKIPAFLTSLRQITVNDQKISWLINYVNSKTFQKIVIYVPFVANAKKLQKVFPHALAITGSVSTSKRETIRKEFNNSTDSSTILIITDAGTQSIDLLGVTDIVVLSLPWTPSVMQQIIGRGVRYQSHAHLPLTERFVNVIIVDVMRTYQLNNPLELAQGVDLHMSEILRIKRTQMEELNDILEKVSV